MAAMTHHSRIPTDLHIHIEKRISVLLVASICVAACVPRTLRAQEMPESSNMQLLSAARQVANLP